MYNEDNDTRDHFHNYSGEGGGEVQNVRSRISQLENLNPNIFIKKLIEVGWLVSLYSVLSISSV